MEIIYTYFKNSKTNELILNQEFVSKIINDISIYYYRISEIDKQTTEIKHNVIDLTGFVKISKRKFERIIKII